MALLDQTMRTPPEIQAEKQRQTKNFSFLFLVFALGALGLSVAQAQPDISKEYQIKAVFLFNFTQFVEWPVATFPTNDTPICIGILGNDPFGPSLEETVQGETIGNRKLVIQRSHQVEDLKNCHLLFISKSEQGHVPEILSALNPTAVLTVSEVDGFTLNGGNINFYLEGNKVRFEINPDTARSRGIKLSSQLLRLGKIINRESIEWSE
jgi:hypothetical protein